LLIKEVKQGAKIDFEKTNITISKFKVSTNHWLSTLLSSLYAFLLVLNKLISYCLSGYLVISQIAISNKQNSKNARGKDKTHKT